MKNKKIIIGLCSVLLISGASLISCNNNDSSNDILSSTVSVDKLALERRITYISNNMINDEYQNNYTKESYDNFEIEFQDLNKNDDIVYSYIESLKNKYSLYDLYLVKNRPYENYIYACIFIKKGE